MSLVSIVLLTYNNYADTLECLESLLRLDYPSYQVVIIDNSSADEPFNRIKGWLSADFEFDTSTTKFRRLVEPNIARPVSFISYSYDGKGFTEKERIIPKTVLNNERVAVTTKFPVILIRTYQNLGFSASNNLGVKFVLGSNTPNYFWFLNNDIVVESDSLKELVITANKDATIGAVGSKVFYYHRSNIIQYLAGGKIRSWNIVVPYQGREDFPAQDYPIKGFISGCSFLIKREIIDKVGLWDERFFISVEDIDYSFRISKAGYKLFFCAKSRLYHKLGSSVKRQIEDKFFLGRRSSRIRYETSPFTHYYCHRNWVYFNFKHRNLISKIIFCVFFLPFYILGNLFFIVLYDDDKLGKVKMVLRAVLDGFVARVGRL
jgi:hypothetical protein